MKTYVRNPKNIYIYASVINIRSQIGTRRTPYNRNGYRKESLEHHPTSLAYKHVKFLKLLSVSELLTKTYVQV
jgi:hypothetical protein